MKLLDITHDKCIEFTHTKFTLNRELNDTSRARLLISYRSELMFAYYVYTSHMTSHYEYCNQVIQRRGNSSKFKIQSKNSKEKCFDAFEFDQQNCVVIS